MISFIVLSFRNSFSFFSGKKTQRENAQAKADPRRDGVPGRIPGPRHSVPGVQRRDCARRGARKLLPRAVAAGAVALRPIPSIPVGGRLSTS